MLKKIKNKKIEVQTEYIIKCNHNRERCWELANITTNVLKYKNSNISSLEMLFRKLTFDSQDVFHNTFMLFLTNSISITHIYLSSSILYLCVGGGLRGKMAEKGKETLSILCKMQKKSEFPSIITSVQMYFLT